MLPNTSFTYL